MKNLCFLICLGLFFNSCKVPDEDLIKECTGNSDEVSWNKITPFYGSWQQGVIGSTGGLNYTIQDGISLNGNTNLKTDCGWQILGNESGGIGNTFALYLPPDTAVVFRWAYSALSEFVISNKWQGTTYEGIKMGDTREKFLATYPDFQVSTMDSSLLEYNANTTIKAYFTNSKQDGRLKKLIITTPTKH